jgi:hypothetical protein
VISKNSYRNYSYLFTNCKSLFNCSELLSSFVLQLSHYCLMVVVAVAAGAEVGVVAGAGLVLVVTSGIKPYPSLSPSPNPHPSSLC